MRDRPEPAINGDEQDWISTRWRRMLSVFSNSTGLGRAVKRAMAKRHRRGWAERVREEIHDLSGE